jgi:PDDEXK-like domain of unknown function (DUF3799)
LDIVAQPDGPGKEYQVEETVIDGDEPSAADAAPPEWAAGVFYDMPEGEYHYRRLGECNHSGLRVIRNRTPAHYKAWVEESHKPKTKLERAKEAQHFRLGRIVHSRILEPDRFASMYLLQPDFGPMQSSKNRATRDEWLESQADGAIICTKENIDTANAMYESIMRHKTARLVIQNGKPEVTIRWICPRTGLRCKIRVDWYSEDFAFAMDLKSTMDASKMEFSRSIAKYDYHVQHCLYSEGVNSHGLPLDNYILLPVEKEAPYAVATYHIDAAGEELGFKLLDESMDKMKACVEKDSWPAYSEDIESLTLPGWAYSEKYA